MYFLIQSFLIYLIDFSSNQNFTPYHVKTIQNSMFPDFVGNPVNRI